MVDFSNQPTMKGFFAPTRFEADVYDCEVIGKVPAELNGAFVRLGGDWLYPPKFEDDSPFSMDGYINMFRFKNGIVDYKGRWVKTPRFKADSARTSSSLGSTAIRSPTIPAWRASIAPCKTPRRWHSPENCLR